MFAPTSTFSQSIRESYQQVPEQICITLLHSRVPEQVVTYRDLFLGAAGYARALSTAGVRSGEVVVIILPHGADLVYAFFGAVLQGAIPTIMPFLTEKLVPDAYRASLAALFEITQPAAVITYEAFRDEIEAARTGSTVRSVLLTGQIRLNEISEENLAAGDWPGLSRSPEDIVLLQHSSGTTGLQKGVALSHQAVFNQLRHYSQSLRLEASDVIVSWLPLYHDMGLIAGFLLPILGRVPLALISPFDWVRAPHRLMQAVSYYHGTLCWLPNFAYNFCAQKIRERDLEDVDLSSLRAVINCSEPMHWKSHRMFLERFQPYGLRAEALATCYAMAENVFAVTQGGIDSPVKVDEISQTELLNSQKAIPANADESLRMLSAGRPIQGTRLRVLDPQGMDLPERVVGEIALKSDCMLTGYYNRPDLTEKAFLDGWYLTGDLGYLTDGEVYITGRKKDLIIVGGKNVYPQDLERLAGEVEGIHPGRVVAFGVFDEQAGTEEVVLVAESDESDPELRVQLADQVRRRVTRSSDVALRIVEVMERNWLLKTSSGKIARLANRDKYLKLRRDGQEGL